MEIPVLPCYHRARLESFPNEAPMLYLNAIILAVVEGITEFLPISSTGHMILVSQFLTLGDDPNFLNAFLVMIQLPAILSVVVYFWSDLWPFTMRDAADHTIGVAGPLRLRTDIFLLWVKVGVALIPVLVITLGSKVLLGESLDDILETYLFHPIPVAIALAVGGVLLILVERIGIQTRLAHVHQIGFLHALGIGAFQCLAMIPGTSRSAATIIGGMFLGASRPAAAEFSFFLAIPTMLAACLYKLMKSGLAFTPQQWALLAVGSVVSFLAAYAVIAFLMDYVRKHDFSLFGYYRIALGLLVLAYEILWGFSVLN